MIKICIGPRILIQLFITFSWTLLTRVGYDVKSKTIVTRPPGKISLYIDAQHERTPEKDLRAVPPFQNDSRTTYYNSILKENMPNTGMINNQTFKCEQCRKNFNDIWLPSNACCQISKIRERDQDLRYSRHSQKPSLMKQKDREFEESFSSQSQQAFGSGATSVIADKSQKSQRNKLAPFKTLGKPTCGFNFSRETDNRKKNFGIMPSDLVKWRSEKIERIPIS